MEEEEVVDLLRISIQKVQVQEGMVCMVEEMLVVLEVLHLVQHMLV